MQVMVLSGALALAADPLVTTGSPDTALRHVTAGAGREASSFAPVAWEEFVAGPVSVVGAGSFAACEAAPSTTAQLTLAVEGAEGALGYGDLDKARVESAQADRLAACLSSDPAPALLARWHRARGAAGASDSLALARQLDPSLGWNPAWPAEGAAAFEAAAPAGRSPVAFAAWSTPVSVDGAPPPPELASGVHLVRAGGVTGLLTVGDEALEVVLTPVFPREGPAELGDPAARESLAALFLARYGPGTRVFLADSDEAWAATAGRTDWTQLRRVRRSPLVPVGVAIAVPGAIGVGVGLGLRLAAQGQAATAADDMAAATTTPELEEARGRYDAAASRFRTFGWVAGGAGAVALAGSALLAVGLAQGEIEVKAALLPDGGSLGLVVRR